MSDTSYKPYTPSVNRLIQPEEDPYDPLEEVTDEQGYEPYSSSPAVVPSTQVTSPKKSNFKIIELSKRFMGHFYKLIEHTITRERKWVDADSIKIDGIPTAFYDADPHFEPQIDDEDIPF